MDVNRRTPDYVGNLVLNLSVPDKRTRGRPKTKWIVVRRHGSMRISDADGEKADPTTMWDRQSPEEREREIYLSL